MDIPTDSLQLYEPSPYPLNGNSSSEASRADIYTTKYARPSAATSTASPSEATGSCSSFERTVRASAKLDTPCTTPSSCSSPVFHGGICSLPPSKVENGVPASTSKSSPRAITSVHQGRPVAATTSDHSATHAACTPTSDDRLRDQSQLEPEEDRISFCTHSGVDSQGQKNSLTVDAQPEVHNSQGHIHNGNQPPVPIVLTSSERQPSYADSFQSSIMQEEAKFRWDSDTELHKVSKDLLRMQKWFMVLGICTTNGVLIYAAWQYSDYYYVFLPLLCANTFLQAIMIVSLVLYGIYSGIVDCFRDPDAKCTPSELEKIVMVLPCYNETREEIEKSLDSLVAQKKIEDHARLIFIIVDGNAKGPGMDKTTQEYLLDDILQFETRKTFDNGYRARDGLFMACTVQEGLYKGTPYILLAKRYNQGKRDSLCFVRSFLYHFRSRSSGVSTMFNPNLFEHLALLLIQHGLDNIDYLVGMDADTVFDVHCVWEMVRAIRREGPSVVGVCGHVCVAFEGKNWGFWNLYQSLEYTLTQGLRRLFQSNVTGKVNCLPGCCQLLRVEEATFGDEVLREKFGYVPKPNDHMTLHIMGNYSEDSIHASVIFSAFPGKRTAQTLRAKAYTAVPQNWTVFLSQRKRWSLGSVSNEFVMIFRPGIILVERIQSIITVITWWLMPFILAAVVALVLLFVRKGREIFKDKILLGLAAVLLLRYIYSFCLVFWLPTNNKERLQFIVGYLVHILVSPFVNFIITVYSMMHSDDFKWGKTREVIESETEELFEGDEKRPTML